MAAHEALAAEAWPFADAMLSLASHGPPQGRGPSHDTVVAALLMIGSIPDAPGSVSRGKGQKRAVAPRPVLRERTAKKLRRDAAGSGPRLAKHVGALTPMQMARKLSKRRHTGPVRILQPSPVQPIEFLSKEAESLSGPLTAIATILRK